MSVLGRFAALRGATGGGAAPEQRSLMNSSFVPPPAVGVIDDFVGVHRAMAHMTVFACVRLLADTIASLPWKAYRRDSKGVPKPLPTQPQLVIQPMQGMSLFEWKWMVVASMALRGNSYHMVVDRDKYGYPTTILPLHPDIVFLERRPDVMMWMDPIYRVMGEPVPKNELVHMRRFTMPGEPWGMSPIRQAAVAIGLGLSAEEYGYRFYKESATPSGTLMTDQDVDEETLKLIQQNWIASHSGRRLPAVLSKGFKFDPISIAPDEAQFLETRQFQRSEICLLFGVPPILIGDTKETTAWGTGVEQITLGAVTYTFRPWTSLIEDHISALLPRGQFVRFDYNALLRGDMQSRYSALKEGVQGSFLTPNEVRAGEELDPLPHGDELLGAPGYVPLGTPPPQTVKPAATGSTPATPQKAPPKSAPAKTQPAKKVPTPSLGGGEMGGNGNSNRNTVFDKERYRGYLRGGSEDDSQGKGLGMIGLYEQEWRVAVPLHGKHDAMLNGGGLNND